ncbi:MAG TPA: DUF4179 domain-containing protein [Ktedonobacterales bacterium]
MTRPDTPFERKRIDDEIARLERLDWTEGAVTPDARLIADLRHAYRWTADDVQSLDTVFSRVQVHARSVRAPAAQERPGRNAARSLAHTARQRGFPLDTSRPWAAPGRQPIRRVALATSLALVLVMLLSLVFVEFAMRQTAVTPAHPSSHGLDFTTINITKSSGGVTVHLERAYADATNIYLRSTVEYAGKSSAEIDPPPSSSWEVALTTSSGVAIPFMDGGITPVYQSGTATATSSATPVNEQLFTCSYHFDGTSVKGTPSSLRLTLRLTPPQGFPNVTVPRHGTQLPPLDFTFTVPFHAGQAVVVGQTATSHGWSITLDRIVITPSETRAYFHNDPRAYVYAADLHVAGRTYKAPGGVTVVGTKGMGAYGVTFDLALDAEPPVVIGDLPVGTATPYRVIPTPQATFQSLEGQTGSWTLRVTQIYIDPTGTLSGDWAFDFTVP